MKKRILVAATLALIVSLSLTAEGNELIVSAAASLTDVLTELKPEAEKAIGAKLLLNFGGSGALRKQIEQGAPADLFFSAAKEDMDKLEKASLVVSATRRDLLANSIVLVGDKGRAVIADEASLAAALGSAKFLAIGNPDSVPAGRYAVEALKSLGLYASVEKKLVLGGNVREVLQYVESGSSPLGIVFLTDAMTLKAESPAGTIYRFPLSAVKTPVVYPIAVVSSSKVQDKASLLIEFLRGDAARAAFEKAGFVVE
jgi:molybdate transport system substrate-binding protein